MLVDKVNIEVKAGNGGGGLVSFRKEKFQPFGGPDGGDGGKGGDVYVAADSDLDDLAGFKHKKFYKARDGQAGGTNKMHGTDAQDIVLNVPPGTTVYLKSDEGELLLGDLHKTGQKIRVAAGGKGGRGNVHFATATRKAPKISQPGLEGQRAALTLKLKLPIDVAVIGLPNSGKSSLLSAVSGARPRIAGYPFSTREPVQGVVEQGLKKYTWAELPAVTPGAHSGRGLGNHHLIHAERAKVILYLLDISSENIEGDLNALQEEVALFQQEMTGKKSIIVLNKEDLITDPAVIAGIKERLTYLNLPVQVISAQEKTGLDELVDAVHTLVNEEISRATDKIQPEVIFRPKPVDTRR